MKRRTFIKNTVLTAAMINLPLKNWSKPQMNRAFKICLDPNTIGVSLNQRELLAAALKYDYEAIIPKTGELLQWTHDELKSFNKELAVQKIDWGSAGLPVEFRQDEDRFTADLKKLKDHAQVLKTLGATRMTTWIMPTHDELAYQDNFLIHLERLKECAIVLSEYDVRLGLEYVGPKTLMTRDRFPFIHTLLECLQLIDGINEPNVGVVLDTFHWYCGQDTIAEVKNLDKSMIISVDLNDAVKDVPRDQQLDGERELPGATGVVDIEGFLEALLVLGYDGPVRSEPFNRNLNEMEDSIALRVNRDALGEVIGE